MRLEDAYRLLDVDPATSDFELKRSHRDLTKVWHPDRFGHDPGLRGRAEEKLKAIHEAYATIREVRGDGPPEAAEEIPDPSAALALKRFRRERTRAFLSAGAAVFLLLRRPTPPGILIALVLLGLSLFFVLRMRAADRASLGPG